MTIGSRITSYEITQEQQNEYMYELERGMDRLERELEECKQVP